MGVGPGQDTNQCYHPPAWNAEARSRIHERKQPIRITLAVGHLRAARLERWKGSRRRSESYRPGDRLRGLKAGKDAHSDRSTGDLRSLHKTVGRGEPALGGGWSGWSIGKRCTRLANQEVGQHVIGNGAL